MEAETEADCLLRSGLAYPRRLGLVPDGGTLVFAGFKPGAFSLYLGDEPYFHFDLEGRWQRVLIGGIHYLKALDGAVESITRERTPDGMVLRRQRLLFAETADLDSTIRTAVLNLIEGLEEGQVRLQPPPEPASQIDRPLLREMLDRITLWDHAAWFHQREQYLSAYGPSSFLPPSCPSPIVLEASVIVEPAKGFSPGDTVLRTPREFADHARAAAKLLGRRAAQSRGLVIQHGDLWNQPAEAIRPYLEVASQVFPVAPRGTRPRLTDRPLEEALLDGFYAFIPGPPHHGPDPSGWASLAENGLRRVDIGLVSVFPETRSYLGILWSEDALTNLVHDLQASEIGVGLVLSIGTDPSRPIEEEAEAAASLLKALNLRPSDHVYLIAASEIFAQSEDAPPPEISRRDTIRARLQADRPKGGYRVAPYSLTKQ